MDPNRRVIRRASARPAPSPSPSPSPSRRARTRTAAVSLAAATVAIALAGCAPSGPTTPATTTPPAETTPPPTTQMPPASDTPATGSADRPLEAIDAYALCRAQTYAYYPGDFALLDYAPFSDATVLQRDDGDWFVYLEVDDGNRTPDLVESGGSECIVGGTIGEPEWQSFGVISRDVAADSIANFNRPPAQA